MRVTVPLIVDVERGAPGGVHLRDRLAARRTATPTSCAPKRWRWPRL